MYATLSPTPSLARPAARVIPDDGEAFDVLTRLFEAAGFEVTAAPPRPADGFVAS